MGMVGLSTRYLVVDGGEPILTPLYWRIRSGAWNLISLGLGLSDGKASPWTLHSSPDYPPLFSSNSQGAGPVALVFFFLIPAPAMH